ncbi:MAG: hypothetical protein Q7J06_10825, partial [Bacteroidales bacterium]|nr:hypothetical protein [Bacteroidales bacterium]
GVQLKYERTFIIYLPCDLIDGFSAAAFSMAAHNHKKNLFVSLSPPLISVENFGLSRIIRWTPLSRPKSEKNKLSFED